MAPDSAAPSAASLRLAHGGKTVYGARIGILILETQYPRIPGDPVNAMTWPFPVLYKVVDNASPARVVEQRAAGLLEPFVAAAKELIAMGADGIVGNCGFLVLFQDELAKRLGVPVAMSSLLQVPLVARLLPPGKRVGILTVNKTELSAEHLRAAGIAADTPVSSTENGREFNRTMYKGGGAPTVDVELNEADVLDAGISLVRDHPDVGAIVVECTRMVPYSRALAEATGLPVFDIYNFVTWFHAGLAPRDFGHPGSAARPFRER
ncbi:MAG: aspartate/glutamate racemase family protein [Rhodospirillaceae bacterium]|nr:aspartate/glutamate racemase family protein [Rhodospirillaceae bacterium]